MGQRKQKNVLFLGGENYLAGRCAEALFNAVAGKMSLPWTASSRMLAGDGERKKVRVSPDAQNVLNAMKLRITEELTKAPSQLTLEDLENSDRIVAMNQAEHLPLLQERFPAWVDKVECWEIDGSPDALKQLEHEVMDLAARTIRGGERQKAPPPELCPKCGQPLETCTCESKKEVPRNVTVRVGRETKGRRGKGVTTISDLPLEDADLVKLAAKLKQRLGTGGTVKDKRIEIQGDHRDRLVTELENMGYRVKRAGG
jgi:translation initiation factor 1